MKKIFQIILGSSKSLLSGENGLISLLKERDGKMSSRRVSILAGGGSLVTIGLNIIQGGLTETDHEQQKIKVLVGLALTFAGVGLAALLGMKK